MANTDKNSWDHDAPATATGLVSEGGQEIRYLREGIEARVNKQHVALAASGAGGEHLEGSARITVGTSAPLNQAVGAKDTDGAAADVTIASAAALAKGAMWSDSGHAYVLQVYNAGWQDVGYLALAGGTVTGATTFSAATTFSSTLIVTSAGSIAVNTDKFTVAGDTGNTVIAGTCSVTGDFKVNTTYFTVAAATGNTVVSGTLSATGDFKVNTTKFVVTASSGNTAIAGTLDATGDFKINSTKFTVTASSGNTNVAGTLNSAGAFSVATDKFTVGTDGTTYSANTIQALTGFTAGNAASAGTVTINDGSGNSIVIRTSASTTEGHIWYDFTAHAFKYYNGTTAKTIATV